MVGILCGYEATKVFSMMGDSAKIGDLILEPLTFLEGAIFFLACFIILSNVMQIRCIHVFNQKRERGHGQRIFLVVDAIVLVLGWGYLFSCSIWVAAVLLILTAIHFGLSFDKIQREVS